MAIHKNTRARDFMTPLEDEQKSMTDGEEIVSRRCLPTRGAFLRCSYVLLGAECRASIAASPSRNRIRILHAQPQWKLVHQHASPAAALDVVRVHRSRSNVSTSRSARYQPRLDCEKECAWQERLNLSILRTTASGKITSGMRRAGSQR